MVKDYQICLGTDCEKIETFRRALYSGVQEQCENAYAAMVADIKYPLRDPFIDIAVGWDSLTFLDDVPAEFLINRIPDLLDESRYALNVKFDIREMANRLMSSMDSVRHGKVLSELVVEACLCGEPESAAPYLKVLRGPWLDVAKGTLAFYRGDFESAVELFGFALELLRKETRRKRLFLSGQSGFAYIFALLSMGNHKNMENARQLLGDAIARTNNGSHQTVFNDIQYAVEWKLEPKNDRTRSSYRLDFVKDNLSGYYSLLTEAWRSFELVCECSTAVEKIVCFEKRLSKSRYRQLHYDVITLLKKVGSDEWKSQFVTRAKKAPTLAVSITNALPIVEHWQNACTALINLSHREDAQTTVNTNKHVR